MKQTSTQKSLVSIGKIFRPITEAQSAHWRSQFLTNGVVIIDELLTADSFKIISYETQRMLDFARRKDIQIDSNGISDRKMRTVGGRAIKTNSKQLRNLYLSSEVLLFLKRVTGEEVYVVPDENEDIVINNLHRTDDVHGKHIDTYSFAFNIMVSAPPRNAGGELIIHSKKFDESKMAFYISSGACYLIRTDQYEHEVSQLTEDVPRLVLNMAYSNNETRGLYSYSSDVLYS